MIEVPLHDLTPDEIASAGTTFKDLVRMTSLTEAVALCREFGGEEMRLPSPESEPIRRDGKTPQGVLWKHTELRAKLKALLSDASYERLLHECGGCVMFFPFLMNVRRVRRDRMIMDAIKAEVAAGGLVVNAMKRVIREHELSRSYVHRIIKRMKALDGMAPGEVAQPEPRKLRTRRLPAIAVAPASGKARTYKTGGLAARIASVEAKRTQPSQEETKA